MNKLKLLLLFLITFIIASSFVMSQKHPRELPQPTALKFIAPKPVEFTLSNGIKVFFLEDKELPIISLSGIFKGGSLCEPNEKVGLASLTGTVMRTGGTKSKTGEQIDEELEFLAASVETSISSEFSSGSANCMKKDFKRVLEIYADILMNPEFRQDKLDLARNQSKESIRRRWDQPSSASSMLFNEKLFSETPYARRTSAKSLINITREDLIEFHKRFFVPNNMYLGIYGDISRDEVKDLLEEAFKNWKKRSVKIPDIQKLTEKSDGTIYYAFKETPQANVNFGHLGVKKNNPDEFKLEILNDIFGGGGFTSRLMKEIRSNRGLTYGIYGGVGSGTDRGVFQIGSQLKADRCIEAINAVKDIIKDLQNNPVSDEEIETSKNSLINSFVFKFERKQSIVSQYINLKLDDYPDDYFDTYIENIKKVTKKDIQEAAKKYMDTDKMIFSIVGNEKLFDKPLSSLGKIKEIDIKKIAEEEKNEK